MVNKALEFLKDGSVTLKKVHSPLNGELTVKWDTVDGYQILGGPDGLWQVGGPVEAVWKRGLKKFTAEERPVKKALILGLGGGTIAKILRKKYPDAKIVGVDLDPVIVQLGKEYFGLNKLNVEVSIADAFEMSQKIRKDKFDLICVDLYVGDKFPEKFATEEFVNNVQRLLSKGGYAIFNRLYFGKHTAGAEKFLKILKEVYSDVEEIHLLNEANAIYICS